MGRTRVVLAVCALLALSVTSASLMRSGAKAEEIGGWTATTSYPLAVAAPCVTTLGYIYCIAGIGINLFPPVSVNDTYYAPLIPNGLGAWSRSADYPLHTSGEACVTYSGYIYCIGGEKPPFSCPPPCSSFAYDSSFYAPLSSNGIGTWVKTTSYPRALARVMCVASPGYVYCIGGTNNLGDPSTSVNESYYAPISASGIGAWKSTTSMPGDPRYMPFVVCASEDGYIYCVKASGDPDLYAPLTSSGIGSWMQTNNGLGGQSCVAYVRHFYCVGGSYGTNSRPPTAVTYALDFDPGISPSINTTSYPQELGGPTQYSCVAASGRIFCEGGEVCASPGPPATGCKLTNKVYFADIIPSSTVYLFCCEDTYTRYFYPQNLTVAVGVNNTVRWYNSFQYDVTDILADDGSFNTGIIRSSNFSVPITFSTPGTYSYHGIGPSPNGPSNFGSGTIKVVNAVVVTTTATYLFTTTVTRISTLHSTATITSYSTFLATTSVGTTPGAQGAEVFAILGASIALVVGFVIGLMIRRRQ